MHDKKDDLHTAILLDRFERRVAGSNAVLRRKLPHTLISFLRFSRTRDLNMHGHKHCHVQGLKPQDINNSQQSHEQQLVEVMLSDYASEIHNISSISCEMSTAI